MKTQFALVAALAFALVGCGHKEEAPAPKPDLNNNSSGNPVTAPVDYLGAVAKAKKTAEKNIDTVSLNQAIQLFNVQEGHMPKDLDELVKQKYIKEIPKAPYGMKIKYDATKGEVTVVPDPAAK